MSLTPADIKTRFPEFAGVADPVIQRWLDEGARQHNAECWGAKSDDGLAYMVAHFLTAFPDGADTKCNLGAGVLTSSKVGDVAGSWSPMTIPKIFTEDDFGTTKYGRRYLSLQDTVFCCRCT